MLTDSIEDIFRIAYNVSVPESQDRKPLGFEPVISLAIFIYFSRVLTSIKFYNQFLFKRHKIYDVVSYPLLPPELHPDESFYAKSLPKQTFGIGRMQS